MRLKLHQIWHFMFTRSKRSNIAAICNIAQYWNQYKNTFMYSRSTHAWQELLQHKTYVLILNSDPNGVNIRHLDINNLPGGLFLTNICLSWAIKDKPYSAIHKRKEGKSVDYILYINIWLAQSDKHSETSLCTFQSKACTHLYIKDFLGGTRLKQIKQNVGINWEKLSN